MRRVLFIRASDGADTILYARDSKNGFDKGIITNAKKHFQKAVQTAPKITNHFVPFPTSNWVAESSFLQINNALCPEKTCSLHGARKVYFRGSLKSSVVLVGEAPGFKEAMIGVPFVGRSGELLDKILAAAGYRQDYCITNTVLCHPQGNRDPQRWEKACCLPRLLAFLEKVKPKGVICVGTHAASTFWPIALPQPDESNLPVNCIRTVDMGVIRFLHIRHPAYILRKGGLTTRDRKTKDLIEDTIFTLKLFLEMLGRRVPGKNEWRWTPHLKQLLSREFKKGDLLVPAD